MISPTSMGTRDSPWSEQHRSRPPLYQSRQPGLPHVRHHGCAGRDVASPGVRLNNREQGFITISTLDESNASEPCGVPLSYLVVNSVEAARWSASYTTGTAAIPTHADHVGVNAAAAQPNSTILLTVDATVINESMHLPG